MRAGYLNCFSFLVRKERYNSRAKASLRKQPTSGDASAGFHAKWKMKWNEMRPVRGWTEVNSAFFPIFGLSSALARMDLLPQTTDTTKKWPATDATRTKLYDKYLEYCKTKTVRTNSRAPLREISEDSQRKWRAEVLRGPTNVFVS